MTMTLGETLVITKKRIARWFHKVIPTLLLTMFHLEAYILDLNFKPKTDFDREANRRAGQEGSIFTYP